MIMYLNARKLLSEMKSSGQVAGSEICYTQHRVYWNGLRPESFPPPPKVLNKIRIYITAHMIWRGTYL